MDDPLIPLAPIHFFEVGASIPYLPKEKEEFLEKDKSYLLPDTTFLTGESSFANVSMGWNEGGLSLWIVVNKPFEKISFPDLSGGDNVQLFFDTRDVKNTGWSTRFCHHFFFLPESFEGIQAGEIPHFRGEERHEICEASSLYVKSRIQRDKYTLKIFIPENCLFGYDPSQFKRLGFTYQIIGPRGLCQSFSAVGKEYPIEHLPSLWSSLQLADKKDTPL